MPTFRISKVKEDSKIPARNNDTDIGLDLAADDDYIIEPGEWQVIGCGVRIELPIGVSGLVFPRSGLAKKYGITVLNAPGLIDSGYRGEIGAILINHGKNYFPIKRGDRIAQLVIVNVGLFDPIVVDELSKTERGDNGLGSSGVR